MKSYTHRWSHSEVAPADAWAEVKAAAFAVMLAAGHGTSREWVRPALGEHAITIDGGGDGDSCYESFTLTPFRTEGSLCDTGKRPFDAAVTAILAVAAERLPALVVRSDGGAPEWEAGLDLAEAALGRRPALPKGVREGALRRHLAAVRIRSIPRRKGHKLTIEWSGEYGVESTSTGECRCGWTESGSNRGVVRFEYECHLLSVAFYEKDYPYLRRLADAGWSVDEAMLAVERHVLRAADPSLPQGDPAWKSVGDALTAEHGGHEYAIRELVEDEEPVSVLRDGVPVASATNRRRGMHLVALGL